MEPSVSRNALAVASQRLDFRLFKEFALSMVDGARRACETGDKQLS